MQREYQHHLHQFPLSPSSTEVTTKMYPDGWLHMQWDAWQEMNPELRNLICHLMGSKHAFRCLQREIPVLSPKAVNTHTDILEVTVQNKGYEHSIHTISKTMPHITSVPESQERRRLQLKGYGHPINAKDQQGWTLRKRKKAKKDKTIMDFVGYI